MYPQTHAYFAERVLGKMNDAIALGSIFPDMIIGAGVDRNASHNSGLEIMNFLTPHDRLQDFSLANITHGVNPGGLDYYGDEKNYPFERGYCFEKGRALVDATIKACNIPPEMGWWKAHNIIEMGIEMLVGATDLYGQCLRSALGNRPLVEEVSEKLGAFFGLGPLPLIKRISSFPSYIDLDASSAESLAAKYDYQMYQKHRIHINVPEVAKLINTATELVEDDIGEFLSEVEEKVRRILSPDI